MKIELVVFDMAGTTVRDDDAVNVCLRQALAGDSISVSRDEVNEVMGIAKPLAIRKLLQRHCNPQTITDAKVDAIHRDFLERMLRHYQSSPTLEPMPHTLDVFAQLRHAGVRIALDTGFSRVIVDAILQRLGWNNTNTKLLDATVASDEVAHGRPHPDLLFKAMELTGVRKVEAVAKVGDTPADLQEGTAARAALVLGVTNGSHTAQELKQHPHTHLIADLGQLPQLVLGHI